MDFKLANALGRIVELKDRSTGAHTWRVTMYAQAMAEADRMPISDIMSFMLGAVLHDLGKIDVPSDILSKPTGLTDVEYLTMKRHPVDGWERLRRLGVEDPFVLNVVRSHHERMDGTGYPDGLRGMNIPIEARWFAVIDAFDAMTGRRPYRDDIRDNAPHSRLRTFKPMPVPGMNRVRSTPSRNCTTPVVSTLSSNTSMTRRA